MDAHKLFDRLETDFRLSGCRDDWSEMKMSEYIAARYQERYMGLVTDNTGEIDYVYTAVFPSQKVIGKIISDNRQNTLLFVHHPMGWNINNTPAFSDIPPDTLQILRERKISIYN